MAKVAQREGEHESALFHCHLAVEKALKAVYMKQHREEHPHTHDLAYLAGLVEHSLGTAEVESLKQLSEFVVDARYSDPYWAAEQATNDAAIHWIGVTERLLSLLLHEI
jgi:HEPN domain-containing protein